MPLLAVVLAAVTPSGPASADTVRHWVGSWGASPAGAGGPALGGSTIRQSLRVSAGGRQVRVRFSNQGGTEPLVIGAAHLARPGTAPGTIDPASDHVLTFAGNPAATVPPGDAVASDPVPMMVPELSRLSVSLFVAAPAGAPVIHPDGNAIAYLSEGDATGSAVMPSATTATRRFYLSEIDVASGGAAVVALGDSITDGFASAPDQDHRWPDRLAERLADVEGVPLPGVVNAGISGNRLLDTPKPDPSGPSGLARFDRDVLAVPGVHWMVVLEGINDILRDTAAGLPAATVAQSVIDGLAALAARAHGRGVLAYAGTLTPFGCAGQDGGPAEAARQAVNAWVRGTRAFDAVIDFDTALADPAQPMRLQPAFDSGDHLHPSDAGYRAMGDAVDVGLFQ